MSSTRRSMRTEQWLPLVYFGAALVLVVALLPTVLRTPAVQQNDSATLSPDSPPDKKQTSIIASLNGASSATAGSGTGEGSSGDGPGGTPPPPPPGPADSALPCRGFGDPPRQTESIYSAPCRPGCKSAGATYKNVGAAEIRIGFRQDIGNMSSPSEGPVPTEASSTEDGTTRTFRVLQKYFNDRYNLCGRTLRIYQLPSGGGSGASATDGVNAAVAADEEYHVFASYVLNWNACQELARRGLVAWCNPVPDRYLECNNGRIWNWLSDWTKVDQIAAELTCKQLRNRTADHTDDPVLHGKPRRIGIIFIGTSSAGFHDASDIQRFYQQQCGGTFDDVLVLDDTNTATDQGEAAAQQALVKFKNEGITTILVAHSSVATGVIFADATAINYFPEWVLPSPYAVDTNTVGELEDTKHMRHAFGVTQWELPRPNVEQDCYVAYRTQDPANAPDGNVCAYIFPNLQILVSGLQAAGPIVTDKTYRDGLFALGHRYYPLSWSVGGGFGPGDLSYPDDFGIVWWDPTAIAPESGNPGAYRWVLNGKRFKVGEIPTGDIGLFRSGITGPTSG